MQYEFKEIDHVLSPLVFIIFQFIIFRSSKAQVKIKTLNFIKRKKPKEKDKSLLAGMSVCRVSGRFFIRLPMFYSFV